MEKFMNITKILYKALEKTFYKLGFGTENIVLTFSSRPEADYQCNSVFAIAKKLGRNPEEVALEIISSLEQDVADVRSRNITQSHITMSTHSRESTGD